MPSKKRGRPSSNDSVDNEPTLVKRSRVSSSENGSQEIAGGVNGSSKSQHYSRSSNHQPANDNKPEILEQKSKEQVLKAMMEKVSLAVGRSIRTESGKEEEQGVFSLLVSESELNIVESASEGLKSFSQCSVRLSEPISGSIERHLVLAGTFIDIVKGVFFLVYSIQYELDSYCFHEDSVFHLNSTINKDSFDGLTKDFIQTLEISTTLIPGTKYHLCRYQGTIETIIPCLIHMISLNKKEKPSNFMSLPSIISPSCGDFKRTSKNQTLLVQSSQIYHKYINNEHITTLRHYSKDPKMLAILQIEECKLKTARCAPTETVKQVIKFPLDCLPKLIVNNGARLSDIRGQSKANVIVGNEVVDNDYKEVCVSGVPEGVIFVLDIFFHIINEVLHPELARRKRRFKRG